LDVITHDPSDRDRAQSVDIGAIGDGRLRAMRRERLVRLAGGNGGRDIDLSILRSVAGSAARRQAGEKDQVQRAQKSTRPATGPGCRLQRGRR
jgi:hypothetical protein